MCIFVQAYTEQYAHDNFFPPMILRTPNSYDVARNFSHDQVAVQLSGEAQCGRGFRGCPPGSPGTRV